MDNSNRMQSAMGSGGGDLKAAMASWNQQYGRNPSKAPVAEAAGLFNQWASQAAPQQVESVATAAVQHLPAQQQSELNQALFNVFQQNGLDPAAAGVQATTASALSATDAARMVSYVQREQPNLLQKLLSNRLVRLVILAILAHEANNLMRGYAAGGSQGAAPGGTAPAPSAPAAPQEGIGDHIRDFLGHLHLPWEHEDTPSTGSDATTVLPPGSLTPPASPPDNWGSSSSSTQTSAADLARDSTHATHGTHRHLSDNDPTT